MAAVESDYRELREKLTAEFIGTYLLVFTVGCNVLGGSGALGVLSIASVLMVSIYALGGVSGGHFNPAVTFAFGIRGMLENQGGMDLVSCLQYIAVQLVAGLLGGFSYSAVYGYGFYLGPQYGFRWWQSGLVEMLFTALLVFTVLNVAERGNQFYGLAIGFTIVAGGYAAGWISGGIFNPAVALGIDASSLPGFGFGWSFAYSFFQLLGAAFAVGVTHLIRPDEVYDADEKKWVKNQDAKPSSRLIAEVVGTFYLMLVVGLNVMQGKDHLVTALSAGALLLVMIYAVGDVSGGHFNPAVTLAVFLRGHSDFTPGVAAQYAVVQIAAAVVGAFTYRVIARGRFPIKPAEATTEGWVLVLVSEVVFTFVLAFVVLSVAASKEQLESFAGLAIGFCVVVGGYAVGEVGGGVLNPAISIAADLVYSVPDRAYGNGWAFAAMQLIGGAAAAGAFYVLRSEEAKESYRSTKGYGAVGFP
mmetsp:Transcript_55589/g.121766  ORF Transcript_55589/g.121766 Transcript_55589/m.121766 type:complete len:473 (-) Transcript_55589:20-1438(-)|eukprot:CAMPEP_0204276798 /NCGR_PEP_ID=MMETSP0468-20130131/28909_1 /ASSEMBLY_ACC=CAM_ASM_000383 /TAXON_ID=2969 /ORGANISM="Oxyrrhis marina" /LENGTH=472 /DNA_ID=CAMNT_0051253497 /DNA_START=53 /DNA_END=1471 /DNA_ORIENTATION=+